ncbi:MAG TPA: 2-dehydropantoate 2-reductase [Candidatus Limnocylindrales bacterium]|nr:2-dehydropantoate 2-reductase [Candidatus Limnocylindrales bacterium]
MKIGIVGAGAIGSTFAARLARSHDVVVLARRLSVAELLARDGIAIEDAGGETQHVAVRATADPHAFADRDAVIVAVKAYATEDALAPLREVLPPHVLVASVQNGLGNVEAARAALPGARVIAGSTTQGAIALGDGRVRPMNDGTTVFARDDTAAPTTGDLAAAFAAARLDARVADDVDAILWQKLIVNAAINPVCALAARPNGAVVTDPDLEALARALAGEAAAVARAARADPGDAWRAVEAAARASAANRNSMLQDLEAGRRTEIEAISGAIVRRAATHGIAVPVTETVLRLVRGRERSTTEPRSKGRP